MSSKEQKPGRKWKQLLREAKQLSSKIGVNVYRRTKILIEIFEDAEWRAEVGVRDDLQAAEWLDAEFKGIALKFLQLRAILGEFPQKEQWAEGDLQTMFASVKPAKPAEQTGRTRKAIKLADFDEVCADRDHYKERTAYLDRRIQELEAERDEHRQEIARLQGRIQELERLVQPAAA